MQPYLRASVAEEVPAGTPPARRVGSGRKFAGGGAPACPGKGRGFAGAEPTRVGLPSFCGPYPERHYREPGVGVAWCPFASLSRAGNLLDAIDLALGTYECQVSAKEVNACSTTGN